jgi:ketosteroid isomerase-like protein
MAEHPNAALVRKMGEAMSRGDVATLEGMIADDVIWHEIGRAEPTRGKDALRAEMGTAEYEIAYEVHDVVANDDHTIALGTATAKRNGRSLTYRTAEIYHIRDGKIVERWAFSDDTGAIISFFA